MSLSSTSLGLHFPGLLEAKWWHMTNILLVNVTKSKVCNFFLTCLRRNPYLWISAFLLSNGWNGNDQNDLGSHKLRMAEHSLA